MVAGNDAAWSVATVLDTDDVADGVRRIVLGCDCPVAARPGSHVDVRVTFNSNGDSAAGGDATRTLTRSYSVVRSEAGGARLTITVQLAKRSRGGSQRMHELRHGDRVPVTAPLQNFALGVGASRYVLLAGGIGITALMAMADALRRRGADYQVHVVGRSRRVLPYLDELTAAHGRRLVLHISDEGSALDAGRFVTDLAHESGGARTELYQCGPIGLMDAVSRAWRAAGLPAANLRFETFGNSGSWEEQQFTVRIPRLDRVVTVPADRTALESLEAAGVAVMADCRKGECGLCAARIVSLEGRVDHRDVFFDEAQKAVEDRLCLCVSRIAVPEASGADNQGPGAVVIDLP